MNEPQLKTRIGLFLVLMHLISIVVVFAMFVKGGFLFEEFTTTLALLIPMFGANTSAIIKNAVINRTQSAALNLPALSTEYIAYAAALPTIFVASILTVIVLKATNTGFATFEQFKITLGLIETAFGVYLGLIVSNLFAASTAKPSRSAAKRPGR